MAKICPAKPLFFLLVTWLLCYVPGRSINTRGLPAADISTGKVDQKYAHQVLCISLPMISFPMLINTTDMVQLAAGHPALLVDDRFLFGCIFLCCSIARTMK
jgi:membrane protein YqaA with SNARE-associated domain